VSKKKTKKQSAEAILAEVTNEMAKPRVAMSARKQVVFENGARVGRICVTSTAGEYSG
jgi:hypothetical protein